MSVSKDQIIEPKTQKLAAQEKYLNRLESIAQIGIIEFNKENGSFYCNQQVYKILWIDSKKMDATYAAFLSFVHPEDRKLVKSMHNVMSVENTNYRFSYRIIRPNSDVRYIEEKGLYTLNSNGEVISIFGTIFDITEKYLLDKNLTQLNKDLDEKIKLEIKKNSQKDQQLFAQSRLAQMGEMISMIAHQWRQPLSAISTTATDLEMRIDLESYDLDTKKGQEECHIYFLEKLNSIGSYVRNLTGTIDDFRNFYKPNKTAVSVNFATVVDKAVNIIRGSLENNNIQLEYNYITNQNIEMYESEMVQVILNILQNAVDNFKEKQTKYPKIMITTNEGSLMICDNGGGIKKTVIDKVFDPYFSTKNEKNGTGLGLYMSSVIIREHHQGKLSVKNSNEGACFVIDFSKERVSK